MTRYAAARKGLLFFSVMALCALLASCGGGGQSFTVVGKINGIPAQRVRMIEINVNDSLILVDSATIGEDGRFELHADATEPGIYQLSFEQGRFIILTSGGGNINITGDWQNLSNSTATITGSPATTELTTYLRGLEARLADINTMDVVLDTAQGRGDTAMLARAQTDARRIQMDITHYAEVYADTTKYLPNALFAIRPLRSASEVPFLDNFTTNLEKRFPGQRQAADFVNSYKQMTAPKPAMPEAEEPEQTFTGEPLAGTQAPDISAQTPDGKTVSLSSFRGKYVLVDFWASWCGPCRAENPNVVNAWNKYKSKNFAILGVSLDDKKQSWTNAIAADGLTWTHISDLKRWESVPARIYNVQGIPANFLIDPTGKIVSTNLRGADLDARLAELLR